VIKGNYRERTRISMVKEDLSKLRIEKLKNLSGLASKRGLFT
jgi:hypothetical protein